MPVLKRCRVCRAEFSVPQCRAETALYCSPACRCKANRSRYKARRISLKCEHCGGAFDSPPSHASRRKYCSVRCRGDAESARSPRLDAKSDGNTSRRSDGYVLERRVRHPYSVGGYVLQHRLVVEDWMRESDQNHPFLIEVKGTKVLRKGISVHHRNEIKDDNRRENLLACTPAAHQEIHSSIPVVKGTVWPEGCVETTTETVRLNIECRECDRLFVSRRSDLRKGQGRFCSRQCASKWHARAKRETRLNRTCLVCGGIFEVWPSYAARGGGKFCSNQCRHKSRIGRNPKEVISYPESGDSS